MEIEAAPNPPYKAALDRVVAFLAPHNVEGWIEYWLWDALEGRRPWPFWLDWDPIRPDLNLLRNEAQMWFEWSLARKTWRLIPVSLWAEQVKRGGVIEAQRVCALVEGRKDRARQEKELQRGLQLGIEEEKKAL